MQAKSQRGFSSKKPKNSGRPNTSQPLNRNSNHPNTAKNRPLTAKAGNHEQNHQEKLPFQLKINPLSSNNNFRPTRPASSATDRIFNKYWENKTPQATNIQAKTNFDFQTPKGESLITNELLVDLKKKKSIYNRSLYKYNKIDWEGMKNAKFLSTVGGLEIKSNNCILNTPMVNYDNFSINSTAIASRPQSNTAFGNSSNNFFSGSNAKNQIGVKKERPLTGLPIKSKNNILRLHSARKDNEDFDNEEANLNNENNYGDVNGFYSGNDIGNRIINGNHLGAKRPLTGNVNKRGNALRPFSAASNKMAIDANNNNKENLRIVTNMLSEELGEEPINEIFNESLSLDLSSEKFLDSPSYNKFKSANPKTKHIQKLLASSNLKNQSSQKQNLNAFNSSNNQATSNYNNNNYTRMESQSGLKGRIKSACGYYPKVETLFKNFEKIDVKAYSIKLQVADSDLLDLFDRSQRTKAATLAKVGDYEYYTPCQRIGSFMDFSATLRWKDLKNIEKHYVYTKNQLGFLQSRHNIITLVEKNFLKNCSEYFRDPNSLFHGFLKDEYLLDKYYKELSESNNKKTYDPYEFLPKAFFAHLHDQKFWDENFTKQIQTSLNNYYKYFNSDKITLNDLEPFNENVRKKILGKMEFKLFESRKKIIAQNFEEIKLNYYHTLKTVIMQYILRSPYERKRLNIQYYPKQTPPSSIIIANHGSFNRSLYKDWVKNFAVATENMEKNLFSYDVISTSILEWTESFRHVNLVYLKHIRNLSYLGSGDSSDVKSIYYNNFYNVNSSKEFNVNSFKENNVHGVNAKFNTTSGNNGVFSKTQTTMHLGHFKEIQASYAMKTYFFLRDVYYRGVVLILKKNKFFKSKSDGEGKWTFKGFLKKPAHIVRFNSAKKKSVNFNLNSNNTTSFNNNNNLINILSDENNNVKNTTNNLNLNSLNNNNNNVINNNTYNSFNSRPTSPLSPIRKSGILLSKENKNQTPINNLNPNNNNNNNIHNKFKPNHIANYENEFFGMDIFDKIEDFWANFFIDDFPDIRMTHSYFLFLANSNKKNIDLSKHIYDQYDDASKLKLNNSITTFVSLFFRQLIEKSVEELVNFILSFKFVDEMVVNLNQQFLLNNPNNNFDLNAPGKSLYVKDNSSHLQAMKQLKEANNVLGNGSNRSSNANIIIVNSASALNINNINNFNSPNNNLIYSSSNNNFYLSLNLNTINEVDKFERSFKDNDEYVTSSGNNEGPISPNNFNTNFNKIHINNKNLIPSLANLNSLNVNSINKDAAGVEPMLSGKSKNIKQIQFREASREVTVKSADTARTKDYNYLNLNNHLLFQHYDINAYISYKEQDIKLPLIKSFVVSDTLNPVMHICTKFDSIYNVVKLEYSYDQVSEIFIKICDNVVGLFNGLYTTHFMDFKTVMPSDVERIQKAHWLRINEVFSDKLDTSYKDYYSNVSPNLIIDTEKFSEANSNSQTDEMSEMYNFFSAHIRNNFLKPALITEEIFVNYRNVIAKTVKEHMLEMEEVLKLFEPVKDLINYSFAELVNNFKENFGTIPEYNKFTFFIEKIRTYMRYVITIPDFVYYSLLAVDTRESKAELIKRLSELMNILMREMENLIIQIYQESIENYNRLHGMIDKKITTPEELVEMEALKANVVNMEVLNIAKNLEDANKIHFFLLSSDNIFSDTLILKTDEMKRRYNKFKRESEEIDKIHLKDREYLEEKFRQDRKKLEQDLQKYYDSINSLDLDIHINTYETIVDKITHLENQIDLFKTRIEDNFKDEEKLFSFRLNLFEDFDRILLKLEKYSVFWQKAYTFYEIKKPVILCFSEELDFLSIINQFNDIEKIVEANRAKAKKEEETLIKMSKILEDDLEITREFILLSYNILMVDNLDDNLRMKIIEMLDNKKLEQSCKLIIENVLKIRNYSLV